MARLSWHDYFFEIAEITAKRSTCVKRQVGAVLVDYKNRILSTGYNGQVSETAHCTEKTCLRRDVESGENLDFCRAIHAEQNAIIFADRHGLADATIYVTDQPCLTCLKILLNAGVSRIFYKKSYNVPKLWYELCDEAGVLYWEYNPNKQTFTDIVEFNLRKCLYGGLQVLEGKRKTFD